MTASGRLYGVGVGPGDPELMSVKAARVIASTRNIAYFAARGHSSIARGIAQHLLTDQHTEIRIEYPVTVEPRDELPVPYERLLIDCYDAAAALLGAELDRGADVVVLCEGDPLFYGSYMYLHNRLADHFPTTVIPGIPSLVAGSAAIAQPLARGDEVLSILSGVMPEPELTGALRASGAAAIIKLGRNLERVRRAVTAAGLLGRAWYIEHASGPGQVCCRLADADARRAPYFSMVVIPSATAADR